MSAPSSSATSRRGRWRDGVLRGIEAAGVLAAREFPAPGRIPTSSRIGQPCSDASQRRRLRRERLAAACCAGSDRRGGCLCRSASSLMFCSAYLLAAAPVLALHAETATPQSVGLSTERLQRVHELVERTIAAGDIAGAVTLVARNGQVAYLEAQGVMDLQSKRPMQPDSMFRLASMSKPVAAVAILMLAEEGKVRLNDPVSRFIPAYANLEVGVAKPRRRAGRAARGSAGRRSRRTAARVLHRARHAADHRARSADAHVGPHERADGQLRRECAVQQAPRPRPEVDRGARCVAARVPARRALVVQRRRRFRRAGPHRRDRVGAGVLRVPRAAAVRAARHARRDVLAEHRAALAARDGLSTPRRRARGQRQPRFDVGPEVPRRRRRPHGDGRDLRAVRDDARERRRAERRADLEPAHRRAHGLGVHSVDAAGPAGRRRVTASACAS